MEKKYSITLSDGTVLDDLTKNGNNFVSTTPIDKSVFDYNCKTVTISDGENEDIHTDMELVQIVEYVPGEYWFVLRDIPENELRMSEMESRIEFVVMMTEVEI